MLLVFPITPGPWLAELANPGLLYPLLGLGLRLFPGFRFLPPLSPPSPPNPPNPPEPLFLFLLNRFFRFPIMSNPPLFLPRFPPFPPNPPNAPLPPPLPGILKPLFKFALYC